MTAEFRISSCAQLLSLRDRRVRREIRRVKLDLADTDPTLARSEKLINRHLHPCGCELAAVLLSIALFASTTLLLCSFFYGWNLESKHYWWMAGGCLLAVTIGKLVGIILSEMSFRSTISQTLNHCRCLGLSLTDQV